MQHARGAQGQRRRRPLGAAVAVAAGLAADEPDALILVNLSGRGDKDVATASAYFGV